MKTLNAVIKEELDNQNGNVELRLNEAIAALLRRRFIQAIANQTDEQVVTSMVLLHKKILFGDILTEDEC